MNFMYYQRIEILSKRQSCIVIFDCPFLRWFQISTWLNGSKSRPALCIVENQASGETGFIHQMERAICST